MATPGTVGMGAAEWPGPWQAVANLRWGCRLLQTQVAGPELVTGGAFGPEGGLLGLGATLFGIALLWLWGQKSRVFQVEELFHNRIA